jgi:YidC/Oxa1 family membrane protein insertase
MAEKTNGETTGPKPLARKELSTETRLLIAFLLMGGVLFFTPYFYKGVAPPPVKKPSVPAAPVSPPSATKETAPDVVPAVKTPEPVSAEQEESYILDTELYRVAFSNRGGVVRSWELKKYKDTTGKPLQLVNTAAAKIDPPFALVFKDRKPSADVNQALYAAKPFPDGAGVEYEFAGGHVVVRKSFQFTKNSYLSQISTEVTEDGKPVPHLIEWRGGFGDMAVSNPSGSQFTLHFDLGSNKLEKRDGKAAKNGPVSSSGNYSFAGIEDTYFAAAFLPERNRGVETMTFSDSVRTPLNEQELPFAGAAIGGDGLNRFSLFVGPKDIDILRKVNPRLEQMVDFGWFSFLAYPLFLAVHWTNDQLVHNYGWSIVLVTIAINFLLFPLKITSMRSMKRMQSLQPQIAAINEKYRNVGMRDPRKAQQNQEVMELYKRHGINPMGGCFPMLLQIPFFIAFYKVLTVSIEMRHANWLWVTDLSQPEHLPIKVLPIAMIATQFVMQKMTPSTTVDPTQRKMMMLMPLFLGYMFYWMSSGLVLYWLTGNLVGIAQQWFFNRTITAADVAQPVQTKKTKNIRK